MTAPDDEVEAIKGIAADVTAEDEPRPISQLRAWADPEAAGQQPGGNVRVFAAQGCTLRVHGAIDGAAA